MGFRVFGVLGSRAWGPSPIVVHCSSTLWCYICVVLMYIMFTILRVKHAMLDCTNMDTYYLYIYIYIYMYIFGYIQHYIIQSAF